MSWLESLLTWEWMLLCGLLGLCVGTVLIKPIERWAFALDVQPRFRCRCCGRPWDWWVWFPVFGWLMRGRCCPRCQTRVPRWYAILPLCAALVFATYAGCYFGLRCQQVAQVTPDPVWFYGRAGYHLILLTLLLAATGTDLLDYVVPDAVTVPGILVGVVGATAAGDLQMIHLWIDWNREALFVGAYIPQWIAEHRHWHGLAWSLAGAACGGGVTWLLRALSSRILGTEALGFGDVTLMAMIGSFLGWQPVVFVFLIAPLAGAVVGIGAVVLGRTTFLPFGPYLSGGAFVVLLGWRWMWEPLRSVFGHWPSLVGLSTGGLAALTILLVLARLYRTLPVEHTKALRRGSAPAGDARSESRLPSSVPEEAHETAAEPVQDAHSNGESHAEAGG